MSPMVAMRTASEIASVDTPSSAATSLIGTTLGDRYRLIEVIGDGGMGRVYRAEQLATGKAVALKPARALRAPRPRSATPASQSSSDLLFYGDQVSDFAMNQSAPDAVSEVADPAGGGQGAFEMTVDDSDVAPVTPTADPRALIVAAIGDAPTNPTA